MFGRALSKGGSPLCVARPEEAGVLSMKGERGSLICQGKRGGFRSRGDWYVFVDKRPHKGRTIFGKMRMLVKGWLHASEKRFERVGEEGGLHEGEAAAFLKGQVRCWRAWNHLKGLWR